MSDDITTESWPPPATPEAPWQERLMQLRGRLNERITVREVQLWGRAVLIDEQHDVWCPDCWRFVSVELLGRPTNGHRVGLPNRAAGALLPIDETHDGRDARDPEGF